MSMRMQQTRCLVTKQGFFGDQCSWCPSYDSVAPVVYTGAHTGVAQADVRVGAAGPLQQRARAQTGCVWGRAQRTFGPPCRRPHARPAQPRRPEVCSGGGGGGGAFEPQDGGGGGEGFTVLVPLGKCLCVCGRLPLLICVCACVCVCVWPVPHVPCRPEDCPVHCPVCPRGVCVGM